MMPREENQDDGKAVRNARGSLLKSYHSLFIALPESVHHMVALMRDWLRGYTSTIANWLTLPWTANSAGQNTEDNHDPLVGTSTKRKFSEQTREAGSTVDGREDADGKDTKRWRGDVIFVAVQDFISKMWGGAGAGTGPIGSGVKEPRGVDEFWKQKPQFDFGLKKAQVTFGEVAPESLIEDKIVGGSVDVDV